MTGNKKQKVLHIITRLDPGGSTINTLETVARLDPGQYEADLVVGRTQDPRGAALEFIRAKGIRCRFVPELVRDVHPWCDLRALLALYGIIRRGRYDIVHTHSSKAGILGRWAAFFAGVRKIVHTPHGHIFYGYFSPGVTSVFIRMERFSARITRRLIALTEKGIEEHLACSVGRPGQWVAVPSGIDVDAFAPSDIARREVRREFGFNDEDIVCVCVARLDPVKNNAMLIAALADVIRDQPQVRLLLVGEGPEREALAIEADMRGLKGRVVFAGFRNDVARALNAGDIFVMASRNEGMGRAALEAMATGLPVIVSRTGGLPAIVADGREGLLVAAADKAAWAQAIRLLAATPELRRKMAEAARMRVSDHFSIARMVRRIEEVYQGL